MDKISREYLTPITVWYGGGEVSALETFYILGVFTTSTCGKTSFGTFNYSSMKICMYGYIAGSLSCYKKLL